MTQWIDFNKLTQWLAKWAMVVAAITALAACGGMNAEKQDLISISKAFVQAGFSPDYNHQIQQKLLTAKTPEQQKAVVQEMKDTIQKAVDALNQTHLKSDEGKRIGNNLKQSFQGISDVMDKALTVNEQDKEALMKLQLESAQAQQKLMLASEDLMALAKKHGVDLTKYQH